MRSLFGARDSLRNHLFLLLTTTITAPPLRTRCSPFFSPPSTPFFLPAFSSACTRKLPAQRVAPLSEAITKALQVSFPTHPRSSSHFCPQSGSPCWDGKPSAFAHPCASRNPCSLSLCGHYSFLFSPGLRSTLGSQ